MNIRKVFIHEEIIPELVKELVNEINEANALLVPVPATPVNKDKWVILDGMHRKKALEELGCNYIPIFNVNYTSYLIGGKKFRVEIGTWCRVLGGEKAEVKEIFQVVNELNLNISETTVDEAKKELDSKKAVTAIITSNGQCYLVQGKETGFHEDILRLNRQFGEIEKKLNLRGYKYLPKKDRRKAARWLDFNFEKEALKELTAKKGKVLAVLLTPKVLPKEVKEVAVKGNNEPERVFVRKTTKHSVPLRPFNVKAPLPFLAQTSVSEKKLNEKIRLMLKEKTLWVWDKGIKLERFYNEPCSIFSGETEKELMEDIKKVSGVAKIFLT